MEQKILREHLETFVFEDFTELLGQWLKSGRQVWYISGNLDADASIKIVENARDTLALESVKIENLIDVRIITLENNSAFTIE